MPAGSASQAGIPWVLSSFTLYGVLHHPNVENTAVKWLLAVLAVILAVLIGASRLYLAAHFPQSYGQYHEDLHEDEKGLGSGQVPAGHQSTGIDISLDTNR